MTDDELSTPGVQKLIIDELERAELECVALREYVDRFHAAEKRAAVLEEKLKASNALEILFAVGVGVGGAVIGLAPFFWTNRLQGIVTLLVGSTLLVGAMIARIKQR